MSERVKTPSLEVSEAHQEQAELEIAQRYQDTLMVAKSLEAASTVSTQEAIDTVHDLGQRLLYAKPDGEGVLVLNQHGGRAGAQLESAADHYQRTIERVAILNPVPKMSMILLFLLCTAMIMGSED